MPKTFEPFENDPEYPEYSGTDGAEGQDRFAPPEPGGRRRRITRSRGRDVTSPTPPPTVVPGESAGTPPSTTQSGSSGTSTTVSDDLPSLPTEPSEPASDVDPSQAYGVPPEGDGGVAGGTRAGRRAAAPDATKGAARSRMIRLGVFLGFIAILVIIYLLRNVSWGTGGGSSSSAPAPVVPSVTVSSPASDDPQTFAEAIAEFDEFVVRGTDDQTFDLPEGVTIGVIDLAYNGTRSVTISTEDDEDRRRSVFLGQRGVSRATVPFGVYYYGGNVESISVQTTGDWQLTFRPLTDLEPLPDFYEQQSPAPTTFFYDGPGGEIEVFAEEDDDPRWMRFTLTQNPLLELDTDITRIERTSTVSTYLDPGPSVIVVDPYATSIWSISTK